MLSDSHAWTSLYARLGLRVFLWKRSEKPEEWKRAIGRSWNRPEMVDDLATYDPTVHNVGTITGYEISPGKFLADVDIDWAPPRELLALLPLTNFAFGRPSKPVSHLFYTTPEQLPSVKAYKDIDGVKFLELFGGNFSQYTMVPPSIRSPGEPLLWVREQEAEERSIAHIEVNELLRHLRNYAIAVLFFRHFGHRAVHHDIRLALSGFLMKSGLSAEDTNAIGIALTLATQNDVQDWKSCFETSLQRLKSGGTVAGKTKLIEALGEPGKKIIALVNKVIGNSEFYTDQHGKVLANSTENIRTAIEKLDVRLFYDSFSEQPLYQNGGPPTLLDDHVRIPLRFKIEESFRFLPPNELFGDVLIDSALRSRVHPIREYLSKLTWDGRPRIETWLIDLAKAKDTPFVRSVSAKVLIAAVRRVREPGVKFDEMLILESEQGKAKSTAIRLLCPNSEWFSDGLPLGADAQKIVEQTTGKWIIEASELHGNRGKEVDALKAFMSRGVDGPVRMAYHRLATQRPRQFIIIGTTNSMTGYLKDSTGGRRFWPVKIREFNLRQLLEVRDQLWAEAAHREAQGEPIQLEEELWPAAGEEQEKRRMADDWEDLLYEMAEGVEWIPATVVWERVGLKPFQISPTHSNRISEIMQRFGFAKKMRLSVQFVVDGKASKTTQANCWIKESFQGYGLVVRWVQEFDDAYTGRPETTDDGRLGGM